MRIWRWRGFSEEVGCGLGGLVVALIYCLVTTMSWIVDMQVDGREITDNGLDTIRTRSLKGYFIPFLYQ
jgi:hypothetical protein